MAEIIPPPEYGNRYLYWTGLLFMILNKFRHAVMGYRTPRTFSSADIGRNADYVIKVVNDHERKIQEYAGEDNPFWGKNVLEIGPGPDLGTGLCILAKGAKSYTALDKNKLITQTDDNFYEVLFNKIKDYPAYPSCLAAYNKFKNGKQNAGIKYIHDKDFVLKGIPEKIDLLLSQAVLEHIDDIAGAFNKIRTELSEGACLSNLVDASSHTRYIRDIDPCNILRYSDFLYRLFKFNGTPNRLRAAQYEEMFTNLGFKNIKIIPGMILSSEYVDRVKPHLPGRFQSDKSIDIISFYILAES